MKTVSNTEITKLDAEREQEFHNLFKILMGSENISPEEKMVMRRMYYFTNFSYGKYFAENEGEVKKNNVFKAGKEGHVLFVSPAVIDAYMTGQASKDIDENKKYISSHGNEQKTYYGLEDKAKQLSLFVDSHVITVDDITQFLTNILKDKGFLNGIGEEQRKAFVSLLEDSIQKLSKLQAAKRIIDLETEELNQIRGIFQEFGKIGNSTTNSISGAENQMNCKNNVFEPIKKYQDIANIMYGMIKGDQGVFRIFEAQIHMLSKDIIESGRLNEIMLLCKKSREIYGLSVGEQQKLREYMGDVQKRRLEIKKKERAAAGAMDFYGVVEDRVKFIGKNSEDIRTYLQTYQNNSYASAIDELIRQVKGGIEFNEKYIGRFNDICESFGEAFQGVDLAQLKIAIEVLGPSLKITHIKDLIIEPNKTIFFNFIKNPKNIENLASLKGNRDIAKQLGNIDFFKSHDEFKKIVSNVKLVPSINDIVLKGKGKGAIDSVSKKEYHQIFDAIQHILSALPEKRLDDENVINGYAKFLFDSGNRLDNAVVKLLELKLLNNDFAEKVCVTGKADEIVSIVKRLNYNAEGSNTLISNIIGNPDLAIMADKIIGSGTAGNRSYHQDMTDVYAIIGSVKEEDRGKFKDILSNGKGGLDPKAIAFFKKEGNAQAFAENSSCIERLSKAGSRFDTADKTKYFQTMLRFPAEHKAMYEATQFNYGKIDERVFNELFELYKGLGDRITQDPKLYAKCIVSLVKVNGVIDEKRMKMVADKLSTHGMQQYIENYCVVDKSYRAEVILKKLEASNIVQLDFTGMLEQHAVFMDKMKDVLPDGIPRVMDAVFKMAETRGTFGNKVSKESLVDCMKAEGFDKFMQAVVVNPKLSGIVFDEVKNLNGLSIGKQIEVFNVLYEKCSKGRNEDAVKNIKDTLRAHTHGRFPAKLDVDELIKNANLAGTSSAANVVDDTGVAANNPNKDKIKQDTVQANAAQRLPSNSGLTRGSK